MGPSSQGGESFFYPDALPCVRRCSCWVAAVRGANHFFCPDALPCMRRCSWWVPAVRGERFFREIRWPVRWVPAVRWRNHYFPCNKEALPCCRRGPSCQPLHVQSTSDGSRSLTTLTTPRREHHGSGRRQGLGRGRLGAGEPAAVEARARGEEYEGSLVRLRCEAAVAAGPGQRWE